MTQTVEHGRTTGSEREQWLRWGSYVSARSWGTVREHNMNTGKAWEAVPFEYARSRAYRWSEDGIGGFSDIQQRLCLTAAFWNGRDPYLKERFFGISNEQGNHGEDVKDYFYFLDAVPSYSYMRMLYKYPQVEFPYARLVRENALLEQDRTTYNLVDALHNAFAENRYFDIFIEFAKASPDDLLYRITAINRADQPAELHILPHLFYRNTGQTAQLRADSADSVIIDHPDFANYRWIVENPRDLLFTENTTNTQLLFDTPNATPYTKEGIDAAVVRGQGERVNPAKIGTKCAAHCIAELAPGATWVVRSRLSAAQHDSPFADFDSIFEQRQREADEFYAVLQEKVESQEEQAIQRAAFAGLMWNKSFYHFNVKTWLEDQPELTTPEREESFERWAHFDAHDILSVPDPWEYPWLAAWDISFQIATLCIADPQFAKQQALLMLSERYMRADGAMAAFEGDLGTPHPPVHAWSIWHIYHSADQDREFLGAAFPGLKQHFEWWLKAHQPKDHLFDGGFLGKDNISLLDRNRDIPKGGWIAQVDSTGWMALFTLNLLAIAVELEMDDEAVYFFDHFLKIRRSLQHLWDADNQFLYDVLYLPNKRRVPLKVRSFAGLIPLIAATLFDPAAFESVPRLRARIEQLANRDSDFQTGADGCLLLAALKHEQIRHLLGVMLDPKEFYGPYGLRSLSRFHEKNPVTLELDGKTFELNYEPGEAGGKMFGGNSNWRGPVWAPLNHVAVEALHTYHSYFGKIQQHGKSVSLEKAAQQLVERLTNLFELNEQGQRPYLGENTLFQNNPHWRDHLWFHEFFHAETGQGLGASHQNGWTAFIAQLIYDRGRAVYIPGSKR